MSELKTSPTLEPRIEESPIDKAGVANAATEARARASAPILLNYIGGNWVEASGAGLLDVTNPANGAVLARVPLSGAADVEAATAAAEAALPDWRSRSVGERTEFIYALREKFRARIDELASSATP